MAFGRWKRCAVECALTVGFMHGKVHRAVARSTAHGTSTIVQVRHAVPVGAHLVRSQMFYLTDVFVLPSMLDLGHGITKTRLQIHG